MPWIAEALATDGLQPPTKAVKISVMKDEEPDVNYLEALKAQTSGQFRVQYGEWSASRPIATVKQL